MNGDSVPLCPNAFINKIRQDIKFKDMKKLLSVFTLYSASLLAMAQTTYGNLAPLHVEGNQMKDPQGRVVVLHGVMDTPNSYFNGGHWHGIRHQSGDWVWYDDYNTTGATNCKAYFKKLLTAVTDQEQGAYCDLFRLHLDPAWTNGSNGAWPVDSRERGDGEADISKYTGSRLDSWMKLLYWPIAEEAMNHGMYVIMRPPGVCPEAIHVGGSYQKFLLDVWDRVSKNDSVRKYAGQVSLELANEPRRVLTASGQDTPEALHDFFQPIVDKIRSNGYTGIILVPGSGYQSNYRNYAIHPIEGENIGYAVHNYPGWYNTSDNNCNPQQAIRSFGEAVPVVETNPIVITEVDWSPLKQPKQFVRISEQGDSVFANQGTWATGSTSKWGKAYKAILDHYGNISMTLTHPHDFIDIDTYLNKGQVVPAFKVAMENSGLDPMDACSSACFEWYPQYYQQRQEAYTPTAEDSILTQLVAEKATLTPGGHSLLRITGTAQSGRTQNMASACTYTISDPTVATIRNGRIIGLQNGECIITATYTDPIGNHQSVDIQTNVTFFPLTNAVFNPSIWETGTFDEKTGKLITGQYGFGGWQYASGIDLSPYKYVIVKLKSNATNGLSFRLFDENNYWAGASEHNVSGNKVVVNLATATKTNSKKLDPSHIYIVGFWTYGGGANYIDKVYVSNDGINPVTEIQLPTTATHADPARTDIFSLDGRQLNQPQRGINIIRTTYSDGTVQVKRVMVK